jgi:hypothetical protein
MTKFYRTDLEIPEVPVHSTVGFYVKSQYGNQRVYLTNPLMAAALYDLTGTKTLMPMHMSALKALGFSLVEKTAPKEGDKE